MPRRSKKGKDRASTKGRGGPQAEAPPGGGDGDPVGVDANGGGPVGHGRGRGAAPPEGGGPVGGAGHGGGRGAAHPQGALGGGGGHLGAVGHGEVLHGAHGGGGGQLGAIGNGEVLPGALGGGGGHLGGDGHALGHGAGHPQGVFVGGPGWGCVDAVGQLLPPFFVPNRVVGLVPPNAAEADEEEAPVPEPKKTGKKSSRRKASHLKDEDYSGFVPHPPNGPPPVNENSELLDALKLCEEYEKNVYATKVGDMILVRDRFQNLPVIFSDADLSPLHMFGFYRSSEDMYSVLYPLKVDYELDDGTQKSLPVAPDKEPIDETSHHIVAMRRREDNAVALFLAQNYSGYLVGGKVVYDEEVWSSVKWGVLGNDPLPPSFGKQDEGWTKTKYDVRYSGNLDDVVIDESTGDQIISFFESFREGRKGKNDSYDQGVTSYGELIIDTVIVIFFEGRRFWFVEDWVLVRRGIIGSTFSTVMKDWLKLSKCILFLILYLLEDRMSEAEGGAISVLAQESKEKALKLWRSRQKYLRKTHFPKFFVKAANPDDQIMPAVRDLARQMKLVKNDEILSFQIKMREFGYPGPWMGEIGKSVVKAGDEESSDDDDSSDDEPEVQEDEPDAVSL